MPFADADIRIDLACGKCPDKHWSGSYIISIRANSLRPPGAPPGPADRALTWAQ
jgi:hypothetical protein